MNKKITFTELVEILAEVNGNSKKNNESLLRDFFLLIQDALEKGETVKIKRIGSFKVVKVDARKSIHVNTGEEIEIPEHNKVVFSPDKELAEAINLPFAGFETIELDDNISDNEIQVTSSTEIKEENKSSDASMDQEDFKVTEPDNEEAIQEVSSIVEPIEHTVTPPEISSTLPPPLPGYIKDTDATDHQPEFDPTSEIDLITKENSVSEVDPITEDIPVTENPSTTSASENISENVIIPVDEATPINEPAVINTEQAADEDIKTTPNGVTDESIDESEPIIEEDYDDNFIPKKSFWKGFFWGAVSGSIFILLAIFFITQLMGFPLVIKEKSTVNNQVTNILLTDSTSTDSIKENKINDKPIPQIKTDTISKTRFLTTMAREYYGDYNYWVYIYEENQAIITNPNKIKPGTVVVIPPAEKYKIDKNNPQSLEEAKKKAYIIYKKYE